MNKPKRESVQVKEAPTSERRQKDEDMAASVIQRESTGDKESADAQKDIGLHSSTRTSSDTSFQSSSARGVSAIEKHALPREEEEGSQEDDSSRSSNTTENGLFESMGSEELRKRFQQQKKLKQMGGRGSNDGFDCRMCVVALCVSIIIAGAIAGVVVAMVLSPLQQQQHSVGTDLVTPAPTRAPSTRPPTPSPSESPTYLSAVIPEQTPSNCIATQLPLPDIATVTLYLQVNDNATPAETEYSASLLQRSYESLWEDRCDKYCRDVTTVNVATSLFVSNVPATVDSTAIEANDELSDCDQTLKVVYVMEGTYWGCQSADFPGLFVKDESDDASKADNVNIFDNGNSRLLRRRQLRVDGRILSKRRIEEEEEKEEIETEECPCTQLENPKNGPTTMELLQEIEQYLEALPGVCGIAAIQD
jgi:hypothetical protein